MITLKLRRSRVSSALTVLDSSLPIPLEDQKKSISSIAANVARTFVIGPIEPPKHDGLRWVQSPRPSFKSLIGTYVMAVPGAEVCILTPPNVVLTGKNEELLKHVDAAGMDMSWACHVNAGASPALFVMSAPVLSYMMNDVPHGMVMTEDWKAWVHGWMQKLLRQRYFDGSHFNLFETISPNVVIPPAPVPVAAKKKSPLKKVKINAK
jgi:hypothetical protein